MDTIHIAYAFNNDFAELACVSMASILFNTRSNVHFHILESRVSDVSKEKLSELKIRFPHGEWKFYDVGRFDVSSFSLDLHFTIETYYRLFLPDLLSMIDKVVYIDGDTVVDGDIGELWNTELNGMYCAAAPEMDQFLLSKKKETLGFDKNSIYFNAGVLLLDLNKLREFELLKKAMELVRPLEEKARKNKLDWFPDQDILNYLLYGKFALLKPKFNLQDFASHALTSYNTPLEDWEEACRNPRIIHYVSPWKPNGISKHLMQSTMWEKYYEYKRLTPYSDENVDTQRIKKYHALENHLKTQILGLLNPCGIFSCFFNYRAYMVWNRRFLFSGLTKELPGMLCGRKLALWGATRFVGDLLLALSFAGIPVDVIVDGSPEKHGEVIFGHIVREPEFLRGRSNDYFILLTMQNSDMAEIVAQELAEYGFAANGYRHVFDPRRLDVGESSDSEQRNNSE